MGAIANDGVSARGFRIALVSYVIVAIPLMLTTSHPFDLAALTAPGEGWYRWGTSALDQWKFGANLAALAVAAAGLSDLLGYLHLSGAAAAHLGWKSALVVANVVTASALVQFARARGSAWPWLIGLAWLFNPVALFVASGHGQLEPLAIAFMATALLALHRGKMLVAGFLTALGAGVEYVPSGLLVVVAVLTAAKLITWRQASLFLTSFALTALGVFGPLLLSAGSRTGFTTGLQSSAGVAEEPPSPLSVWSLTGGGTAKYWVLLGAMSAVIITVVASRMARRRPDCAWEWGLGALGLLLVLAVLLNRLSSPQFALIALFGWFLLALAGRLSPTAGVILTGTGLSFYFVDPGSGANYSAFFFDLTRGEIAPWHIPQSADSAIAMARFYVIGLMVVAAGSLLLRLRPARADWRLATSVGLGASAVLVVFGAQPSILSRVGSNGPAEIAAFERVSTRVGLVAPLTPSEQEVRFDTGTARRAVASDVLTSVSVEGSVPSATTALHSLRVLPSGARSYLTGEVDLTHTEASTTGAFWLLVRVPGVGDRCRATELRIGETASSPAFVFESSAAGPPGCVLAYRTRLDSPEGGRLRIGLVSRLPTAALSAVHTVELVPDQLRMRISQGDADFLDFSAAVTPSEREGVAEFAGSAIWKPQADSARLVTLSGSAITLKAASLRWPEAGSANQAGGRAAAAALVILLVAAVAWSCRRANTL